MIDTILYVLRTGCAWRLVPHVLAPWDVAYRWFRCWSADGTWDRVHDQSRDAVRVVEGVTHGLPWARLITWTRTTDIICIDIDIDLGSCATGAGSTRLIR